MGRRIGISSKSIQSLVGDLVMLFQVIPCCEELHPLTVPGSADHRSNNEPWFVNTMPTFYVLLLFEHSFHIKMTYSDITDIT